MKSEMTCPRVQYPLVNWLWLYDCLERLRVLKLAAQPVLSEQPKELYAPGAADGAPRRQEVRRQEVARTPPLGPHSPQVSSQ